MKRKGIFTALPLMFILTVFSIVSIVIYVNKSGTEELAISHESGIYNDSFELSVKSRKPGKILYTLNGEIPSIESENSMEYTEPIWVECVEMTNTYSFQICCFFDDGTKSDVYKRDFILDMAGNGRFTTKYVVSIVGDEDKLFGDEAGIFVRGNQFYEYLEKNPDVDLLSEVIPANYFSDIEVPVHAAIFLPNGEQIIEQNCGIQIYGNITRQNNQKSFRLYARYEYDDVNEFSYPFFEDMRSENGDATIDKWQRLSFHSSGDDNCYGFVRSTLMGELARQSEYPDTLASESVTVYINGKYQGVYWLQNTYDDRYFEEKYGDYSGEMIVCEGTLYSMDISKAETETEIKECQSYNGFCEWISTADLSDENNWNKVCNTIDIENFAHYFALEYYSTNLDWPDNNVKIYRYLCDDVSDEKYKENTVFDGKWRYLLFDTDYSLGLKSYDFYGYDAASYRLYSFLNSDINTILFKALCQREEFKELFISDVLAMMNTVFEQSNVSDTLFNLNLTRHAELEFMINHSDILAGSLWEDWGVGTGGMAKAEEEWYEIVFYAKYRPQYVVDELQFNWDCGSIVPVQISSEEGELFIRNIPAGKEVNGVWLSKVPLIISLEASNGIIVRGYMVNSEYVEGDVLYLPADKLEQYTEGLNIYPVLEQTDVEDLIIKEYKTNDSQDYVILKNNGSVSVSLNEYAITDDLSDVSKGNLPNVKLAAGEQFWIYGEKYCGKIEKPYIQVPFSWNDEEGVYLYHKQKGIIQ